MPYQIRILGICDFCFDAKTAFNHLCLADVNKFSDVVSLIEVVSTIDLCILHVYYTVTTIQRY